MDIQEFIKIVRKTLKENPDNIFVGAIEYMDYIGRITIPEKGSIYVYLNGDDSFIKIGDGNSYLIDLPRAYTNSEKNLLKDLKEIKKSV